MSQACEPWGSICGCWRCWRLASSASTDRGSQWATGTWSRETCPRPAGSTRSTAGSSLPRQLHVQEERARFSTTSCCPRRWRGRQLSHYPTFACQDSLSQPRLGVTVSWLVHGRSRSSRRCPWDRNARRKTLSGPGQRRKPLLTWSWRGWSGCAQLMQRGAAFTTSSEPSAGFVWGEKQRVGHRARVSRPGHDTRRRCSKKAAVHVTSVSQYACFNCVARPWALGYRLGFFVARSLARTPRKAATCGTGHSRLHRSYGFHQESNATSSQCCGCRSGALLEAMAEGTLPRVGRCSTWLLEGWHRRRRGRRAGRAGAVGQANGDMVAAMVGFAQTQCQAAGRPGGLGRAVATTSTRRGRRCVQNMQEHSRAGSRLHQPQGIVAAASRTASTVHRSAHGLRGKAGQTFVLVTHGWFEAQAIRRSSHAWPHGCPVTCAVSAAEAAGAWEVYGLNGQLVSKLTLKAGGARTHKTD